MLTTGQIRGSTSTTPTPVHLLEPGEQAVWWSHPDPKAYEMAVKAFDMIFALFYLFFSVYWITNASKIDGFLWIFGPLFFALGSWQLLRPVFRYFNANKVIYLLTDRRAIVADRRSIRSLELSQLQELQLIKKADGTGSLLFMNGFAPHSFQSRFQREGFEGIREPARVQAEMRRLAAELTKSPA
jgi:hypothetical protein